MSPKPSLLKRTICITVALLALAALPVAPLRADEGENAPLVVTMLVKARNGGWINQIFTLDGAGGHRVNLTRTQTDERDPVVSPDGLQIAFVSHRDGTDQIYTMQADGSNPINVSGDPAVYFDSPVWSPDGTRILFHSYLYHADAGQNYGEIWVVDADGFNRRWLRGSADRSIFEASWSPVGPEILFREDTPDGSAIWIMTDSASDALRLTDPLDQADSPVWSPTGGQIAFVLRGTKTGIWTSTNDGTNPVRLVAGVVARDLAWSPDGTRLAYIAAPQGRNQIYIVSDDGSDEHPAALETRMADLAFAWSPNGQSIAAVVNGLLPDLGQLVLIDVAAGERTIIVPDVFCQGNPAWLTAQSAMFQ